MIQQAGSGHIGSSFSAMDIVSYLLLNKLRLKPELEKSPDIYFSSKGHDVPGLYAVLIGLGYLPYQGLDQLRRLRGLPGHPDRHTPYIYTNTGSLGMGVSKAKGFVWARRRRGQAGRVCVLAGDGELQEGQFWESLVSAANHHMHEITVIVDHNKIQSDTWVKDVSDLGDLPAKFGAFGWHCEQVDGHDVQALDGVYNSCTAVTDKPQVIIAHTHKGRGVSFMDYTAMDAGNYPYHSGALSDRDYQRAVDELRDAIDPLWGESGLPAFQTNRREISALQKTVKTPPQKLIVGYQSALMTQARLRDDLVVLDADLALDCGLSAFKEQYPQRFIECGIAEQDMVSQAGALALQGMLPVVHSFACFLSARPNEQIYNNAGEGVKTIYMASLAGVLPAGPGHSHQSVRDIGALSAIPGLVMVEPASDRELNDLFDFAVNINPLSTYIRLVSIPWQVNFQTPDQRLHLGRGSVLREGSDVLLFCYGPIMLSQALGAADYLQQQQQISVKVVNLPWLNRIDEEWLMSLSAMFPVVLTLDNHFVKGGQGEMLAAALAGCGYIGAVSHMGLRELPECGTHEEILRHHHLDWQAIAHRIELVIKKGKHHYEQPNRTTAKLGS